MPPLRGWGIILFIMAAGIILIAVAAIAALSLAGTGIVGAPWLPTPAGQVRRMFREAGLKPGETVLDLGCGDGRVLIIAAREFGARGIGVEIDPLKALIARVRVRVAGVADRVEIRCASAAGWPLAGADVVFLYLSHQLIDNLKPRFESELGPGARILSYGFMVSGLSPVSADAGLRWFIYKMGVGRAINGYL